MPVGPWPTFEACVQANQDKEDPEAYCGRIEAQMGALGMWIIADVAFDTDEQAREAERLVRENKLAGISADIGGVTEKLEVLAVGEDGSPSDWLRTYTAGEIVGGTLLPMPAFGDTRIVHNEDGSFTAWLLPEGIKTSDRRLFEPESLSWRDPAPLMFLDKTTATPHADAVFVGNLTNFRRSDMALVASFDVVPEFLSDPELSSVTKPQFTEEGRYVGHGAAWGTCHLAFPGCVTPPDSMTGYELARWKEIAGSEQRAVPIYRHPKGDIHAPLHLGIEETRAWYDEHCSLEGLVEVGPDTFGIWVSGAASEAIEDMYLSGDWRAFGEPETNLELVAFLACKQPAFPLALVASEHQTALVAAGVVVETAEVDPTKEIVARLAREVLALRSDIEPVLIEREAQILLDSISV